MHHKEIIRSMCSDTMHNYIIPGLDSSLLNRGKVRLFQATHEPLTKVAPHSHRYALGCLVLSGTVTNTLWRMVNLDDRDGSDFQVHYQRGSLGNYTTGVVHEKRRFVADSSTYKEGAWYSMAHNEIHSIEFSRGAEVLIFEGPEVTDTSMYLLPHTATGVCDIAQTQPWMFQHEPA